MRVITGIARGKILCSLVGNDVRPTTDKVKEAIFSALQNEIEGAKMLDLFCGSGQMGIEALSRGALSCTFVDADTRSIAVTKQNLRATSFLDKGARVVTEEANAFLKLTDEEYDIAFLDPPYLRNFLQEALPLLISHMKKSGIILCEHDKHDILPEYIDTFRIYRVYKYGRICITTYRANL